MTQNNLSNDHSVVNYPALKPGWQWQKTEELAYLTCDLLQNWRHGFFTRLFWPHTPAELTAILQSEAEIFRVKQVHGNKIYRTDEIESVHGANDTPNNEYQPLYPEADGLVTSKPNQAVWTCTADCTPILIADQKTGQVASVHAGWRGTAAKIVLEAIARLINQGSEKQDLLIAMGPAISGQVYQVTQAVGAEVGKTVVPKEINDTAEILAWLYQLPSPPIMADQSPDKVRLDVRQINYLQLTEIGIDPPQIAIAPNCTYLDPVRFFSYRRDNQKKVQWSGIVSGDKAK